MGFDNNGHICPHNVTETDPDTEEQYCVSCGDVVDDEDAN